MILATILLSWVFCSSMPAQAHVVVTQASQPSASEPSPQPQQPPQSQPNSQSESAPQPPSASQTPPSAPDQSSQPQKTVEQPLTDQSTSSKPADQTAPSPCPANPQNVFGSVQQAPPCNNSASKKHHLHKASESKADSSKTIVRHGSTSDPNVQLAPGVSSAQSSQQVQGTAQLLARTNANLSKLASRSLNSDQQETLKQVKSYMDQSKAAGNAGDVQRAYNLALKANLLSTELVGH